MKKKPLTLYGLIDHIWSLLIVLFSKVFLSVSCYECAINGELMNLWVIVSIILWELMSKTIFLWCIHINCVIYEHLFVSYIVSTLTNVIQLTKRFSPSLECRAIYKKIRNCLVYTIRRHVTGRNEVPRSYPRRVQQKRKH